MRHYHTEVQSHQLIHVNEFDGDTIASIIEKLIGLFDYNRRDYPESTLVAIGTEMFKVMCGSDEVIHYLTPSEERQVDAARTFVNAVHTAWMKAPALCVFHNLNSGTTVTLVNSRLMSN